MKKILLIACALLCSASAASAQNKFKDFFKNYDWTPKYKAEVNVGFAITGANAKVTYDQTTTVTTQGVKQSNELSSKEFIKTNFSRLLVETIHGVQFDEYLFVGGGIGLQYYAGKLNDYESVAADVALFKGRDKVSKRWNMMTMPIFANIRLMYPVREDIVPFLNLGIGASACFNSAINLSYEGKDLLSTYNTVERKIRVKGGLYCDFGAGVRWRSFNFAIGLQSQGIKLVETTKGITPAYEVLIKNKIKTTSNSFYLKVGYAF